jgi:hsp70-interacting protein
MAKAMAHSSKRTTHHLLLAVSLSVSVLLPLLLPAAATAAVADGDGEIKSALGAGRQLATGNWKDEGNLIAEGDTAGGGSVEEDEFAGGFGSLDSMLQWAIGTGSPNPLNSAVQSFDFDVAFVL